MSAEARQAARDCCAAWGLRDVSVLGRTHDAVLCQGTVENAAPVMLKHAPGRAQAAAFEYTQAAEAFGGVPILRADAQACLMPALPGPVLLETFDAG